jgi:hypothetical protein
VVLGWRPPSPGAQREGTVFVLGTALRPTCVVILPMGKPSSEVVWQSPRHPVRAGVDPRSLWMGQKASFGEVPLPPGFGFLLCETYVILVPSSLARHGPLPSTTSPNLGTSQTCLGPGVPLSGVPVTPAL